MEGTMTMPNSQPTNQPSNLFARMEGGREGRTLVGAAVRFPAVLSLSVRPTASKPASQPNHPGGRAVPAWLRPLESVTHMVDVAVVITAGRLHCRGRGRRIVCLSAFRTAIDLRRVAELSEDNDSLEKIFPYT